MPKAVMEYSWSLRETYPEMIELGQTVKRIFEESKTFSEVVEKLRRNGEIRRWIEEDERNRITIGDWYVKLYYSSLDYVEVYLLEYLKKKKRQVMEWIDKVGAKRFVVIRNTTNLYPMISGVESFELKFGSKGWNVHIEESILTGEGDVVYVLPRSKLKKCVALFFDEVEYYLVNDDSPYWDVSVNVESVELYLRTSPVYKEGIIRIYPVK